MKKQVINLVTAVSIIFAIDGCHAECFSTQKIFSKVQVGGVLFNEVEQFGNIDVKPKISSVLAIGGGWYALDKFRVDLSFEYYLRSVFKKILHNHTPECSFMKLKQKIQLSTFMLNGNFDIANFSSTKVFLTSGVGVAKHKTLYSYSGIFTINKNGNPVIVSRNDITKATYKFTSRVGVGLSFNISDQISTEVNYSWQNFGDINPLKSSNNEELSKKTAYKSNSLSLGFRVNL